MSDFTSVDVPSEIRCLTLHGERDSAMTGQGSVGEGLNSGRDYQPRVLGGYLGVKAALKIVVSEVP